MNMEKALLRATQLLVAISLLPMASGVIGTNDAVTRTFSVQVIAEIQGDGGTGIYSPTSPCPLQVFGIRPNVPSAVYYQDDRATTNFIMGGVQVFPGHQVPIAGQPCPLPGSDTSTPLSVALAPTDVWGSYGGLTIDQLLCLKGNPGSSLAVDCFPDADASVATLARCPYTAAVFTPSPVDGKSNLGNLAGSRSLACTGGLQNAITYYNNGPTAPAPYCEDWFFDSVGWGTDFCVIQANDVVPTGSGTSYLVTCMSTVALVTDPGKGSPYTRRLTSRDYILVLDLADDPSEWAAAKAKHWGGTPLLQGWHDLGGGDQANGSDSCPIGATPEDMRARPGDVAAQISELGGCFIKATDIGAGAEIKAHCKTGGLNACAGQPALAPAGTVTTVTCTIANGCAFGRRAMIEVNLLDGISAVDGILSCSGHPRFSAAADAEADAKADPPRVSIASGRPFLKRPGDYVCTVNFDRTGATPGSRYDAYGFCMEAKT